MTVYVKTELSDEIKYTYEKLKELGFALFNINIQFYQDICTKFKTKGDTDMLLADRINYIYNNDDTKCQSNCKLSKYSEESSYINCSCPVSEEVNNMKQKFNAKKIFESFADVMKFSNYKVLKCYNLVFSKHFITKNIGSIIVLIYILIYLGCVITFIVKGITPLKFKLTVKMKDMTINKDIFNIKSKNLFNDDIKIYENKGNENNLKQLINNNKNIIPNKKKKKKKKGKKSKIAFSKKGQNESILKNVEVDDSSIKSLNNIQFSNKINEKFLELKNENKDEFIKEKIIYLI